MKNRKHQVDCCLDEIDTCIDKLKRTPRQEAISKLNGWIKKQKAILKELNYKGKIPRRGK